MLASDSERKEATGTHGIFMFWLNQAWVFSDV